MNVLVARYLGKRDDSAVRDAVHSSLIICFAVGVLLLAAGIINVVLNLIFVIVFKRGVDGAAAFYMACSVWRGYTPCLRIFTRFFLCICCTHFRGR